MNENNNSNNNNIIANAKGFGLQAATPVTLAWAALGPALMWRA